MKAWTHGCHLNQSYLEKSGVGSDQTIDGHCATGVDAQFNQWQSDWSRDDITPQGVAGKIAGEDSQEFGT